MPDPSLIKISRAVITPLTDDSGRRLDSSAGAAAAVEVDFNPETLQLSAKSSVKKREGKSPPQVVGEPTVNLSFSLIFDTTYDGSDVREKSGRVLAYMDPPKGEKGPAKKNVPRILLFEWGNFRFTGYLESYKEDIEFFSPEGNPLRATLALSLVQQKPEFTIDRDRGRGAGLGSGGRDAAATSITSVNGGLEKLGDAAKARETAQYNGIENMRFPEKQSVFIPSEAAQAPPGARGRR